MIFSALRHAFVATLIVCAVAACESDDKPSGGADAGVSGAGGKGGGKGTGGSETDTGTPPVMCAADAGSSKCRQCLAQYCCSDFADCVASSSCSKILSTQEKCFATPGQETSTCFGDFSRALKGDAGMSAGLPPLVLCIAMHCGMACGGPGAL